MNDFVARMLSDLTASMRFKGTLNLDLNEVATTLVPFPRMHFLTTRCVHLEGLLLRGPASFFLLPHSALFDTFPPRTLAAAAAAAA